MEWIAILMVALAGFFGAGAFSMWRTQHKYAAGVLAALALVCVAVGIIAMIPGPEET